MNKLLIALTATSLVVRGGRAVEMPEFEVDLEKINETQLKKIAKTSQATSVGVFAFTERWRHHMWAARKNGGKHPELTDVTSDKYFESVYKTVPTEIARKIFNIKGGSVEYADNDDILTCDKKPGYKEINEYDQANMNYLVFVNVLNRMLNRKVSISLSQQQDIINQVAGDIKAKYKGNSQWLEKHNIYVQTSISDISAYFDQMNLGAILNKLIGKNIQKETDATAQIKFFADDVEEVPHITGWGESLRVHGDVAFHIRNDGDKFRYWVCNETGKWSDIGFKVRRSGSAVWESYETAYGVNELARTVYNTMTSEELRNRLYKAIDTRRQMIDTTQLGNRYVISKEVYELLQKLPRYCSANPQASFNWWTNNKLEGFPMSLPSDDPDSELHRINKSVTQRYSWANANELTKGSIDIKTIGMVLEHELEGKRTEDEMRAEYTQMYDELMTKLSELICAQLGRQKVFHDNEDLTKELVPVIEILNKEKRGKKTKKVKFKDIEFVQIEGYKEQNKKAFNEVGSWVKETTSQRELQQIMDNCTIKVEGDKVYLAYNGADAAWEAQRPKKAGKPGKAQRKRTTKRYKK